MEMEEWICRQNIERFHNRLTRPSEINQRDVLEKLLTREQAKLQRIVSAKISQEEDPAVVYGSPLIQYRCYYFEKAPPSIGITRFITATEVFEAGNDEQAQLTAWMKYRERHDASSGFEIWDGRRLVLQYAETDD